MTTSVITVTAGALVDDVAQALTRDEMVECRYPEGGLGGAVFEALADADVPAVHIARLAVRDLPGSGTPAELVNEPGTCAPHIVDAARRLVAS